MYETSHVMCISPEANLELLVVVVSPVSVVVGHARLSQSLGPVLDGVAQVGHDLDDLGAMVCGHALLVDPQPLILQGMVDVLAVDDGAPGPRLPPVKPA